MMDGRTDKLQRFIGLKVVSRSPLPGAFTSSSATYVAFGKITLAFHTTHDKKDRNHSRRTLVLVSSM
jgi:hypothetical protein